MGSKVEIGELIAKSVERREPMVKLPDLVGSNHRDEEQGKNFAAGA